jgi:hypothetical protein
VTLGVQVPRMTRDVTQQGVLRAPEGRVDVGMVAVIVPARLVGGHSLVDCSHTV